MSHSSPGTRMIRKKPAPHLDSGGTVFQKHALGLNPKDHAQTIN